MAGRHQAVVTRAELARRLGVTRGAVTKACRKGGRIEHALLRDGVDVCHPSVKRWLDERAAARAAEARHGAAANDAIPVDGADLDDESDEGGEQLGLPGVGGRPWDAELSLDDVEQPLAQLCQAYGSHAAFAGWLHSLKKLEDARRSKMLRERVEGRLIPRTTAVRMIDHVDTAFRLILSDAPRTIATRLSAPDMAAAVAMIRDVLSQTLETARDQVAAAIENDDPMAPLMEAAE